MPESAIRLQRLEAQREYYFEEGCFILELWNQVEDAAVSIARARVPPGVTTRLHRLEDIVERYLILEGAGRIELDGQAPLSLQAGDLIWIPAGHPQRITNSGQRDLIFLAICTPRFIPDAYHDLEAHTDDQYSATTPDQPD